MHTSQPHIDSLNLVPSTAIAAAINAHRRTVYKMVRQGKLPTYRVGKKLLFDVNEVRAALRVNPTFRKQPTRKPKPPKLGAA